MSNDRGPGMADGIPMDPKTSLKDAKKKLKLYPSYASEKNYFAFFGDNIYTSGTDTNGNL